MGFKNTVVNNTIIGGGGESVVNERLTYDRPEVVPAQTARDTVIPRASETVPPQQEFVVAALLARAEETSPTPVETIRSDVRATELAVVPEQTEANSIVFSARDDLPQIAQTHSLTLNTSEGVPEQIETVRITPTVLAFESVPAISESATLTLFDRDATLPAILLANTVVIDLNLFPNAVVSNAGWVNPNNILGNNTNTATTLSASSSGLLGGTNNTTNGDIVVDYANQVFNDLDITSAIFFFEISATVNAVLLGAAPAISINFDVSGDNGATWVTAATLTGQLTKQIIAFDVINFLANDKSRVNNFRSRAVGFVRSGTGLGASASVSFFRNGLLIDASKVYV